MESIRTDNMMEQELERSGALMVRNAEALTITTDDDYTRAGDLLKDIKGKQKAVKDYWKEPKAAAQKAHKTLVAREAAMLKPLEAAENVVKRGMLEYSTEKERAAREAAEAARMAREAEAERLSALAEKAAQEGDEDTADVLRDMAEEVPIGEIAAEAAPVAKGVSVRTTWKARVTDPKLVPAYFDGYELRSINLAMLNNLARWQEGQMQIPGVVFYQDSTLTVRT